MVHVLLMQVLQEAACAYKPRTQLVALHVGISERLADIGETRSDGESGLSQCEKAPSRSLWWGEYPWWLYTRAHVYLLLILAPVINNYRSAVKVHLPSQPAQPDCQGTKPTLSQEPVSQPAWAVIIAPAELLPTKQRSHYTPISPEACYTSDD